jgi:hypothetical protein
MNYSVKFDLISASIVFIFLSIIKFDVANNWYVSLIFLYIYIFATEIINYLKIRPKVSLVKNCSVFLIIYYQQYVHSWKIGFALLFLFLVQFFFNILKDKNHFINN